MVGSGAKIIRVVDPQTGRISSMWSGHSDEIVAQEYDWDAIGNLKSRTSFIDSVTDTFGYDALNRLTSTATTGQTAQTVTYNAIGNIVTKSDVGIYTYPATGSARPHAVTSVLGSLNATYTYDNNGNMTGGAAGALGPSV